jgi:hypothetical protein
MQKLTVHVYQYCFVTFNLTLSDYKFYSIAASDTILEIMKKSPESAEDVDTLISTNDLLCLFSLQ